MTDPDRLTWKKHYFEHCLPLQFCQTENGLLQSCLHAQVWAVDLVLYKTLPADLNVGEAWMSPASWIQLFGFSLLLAGTIIYAQVPCTILPSLQPNTMHAQRCDHVPIRGHLGGR